MAVTAEMVKKLRERTGVGMGKCKEALDQCQGDMEKAIDFLRKAGMASAVKKEGRETKEGMIVVGAANDSLAFVEVNSETDFVAQNERFKKFAEEVAAQAASSKTSSVANLLALKYSADPSLTLDQYRALVMQTLGENIQVKRILLVTKAPGASFAIYSHMGGKLVTAVEITGSSDVEGLAREIAMHVAAEAPEYLVPDEIPEDVKAREKEIAKAQVQGKPANIVDKIVEGKLKAFYDQVCLLGQKYVKDNTLSISDLVAKESRRLNKPLTLTRFVRLRLGE